MNDERARLRGLIALAIVLAASCTTAAPSGTAPPAVSSASAPAATESLPTRSPAVPTPSPVTPASDAPTPSRPPSEAPVATLVVSGNRFAGEVGGFTFGPHTDSAPWLPATAIDTVRIGDGAEPTIELDDRATIAGWTLRLADASDVTADDVAGLAEGSGPPISFRAPPAGDWVLSASITYGSGAGDGTYYWHLLVE